MSRHFPYKHPTFGTKKNPKTDASWKRSVYFWWFEYLRRNADYEQTCRNGGKGKCETLYQDFGNVFDTDFKAWWSQGGRSVHLFAEPPTPSIQIVKDAIVLDEPNSDSLVLEVPLGLPIGFLCTAFRKIVSKHHSGKRGVRQNQKSKARYTVSGKVDIEFLDAALRVWDYRQANPKVPFWKIAQELRVVQSKHWVRASDKRADAADKRHLLTAIAKRLHTKAGNMIANVASGKFPMSALKE